MKKIYYMAIAFLAAFSACTLVEHEMPEPELEHMELQAVLESGDDTRTHFDGQVNGIYYPYWSGSELIAVYSDKSSLPGRFSFVSGKDTREATFSGPVANGRHYALYPYESAVSLKEGVLTLTLPAVQTYSAGSIGEGAFPMLAVSDSQTLQFRNLCSVLRLSMTGKTSIQSIVFTAHHPSSFVSGQGTVRTDQGDHPVLAMSEGGSVSVRLDCNDVMLSETVPTDFFIVIPPGTYKGGFTLKIKSSEGTLSRSTQSDIVFERSQIRSIPVFRYEGAEIDAEDLPDNVLLYKSVGNQKCRIWSDTFDKQVVSHTYENGWGKIEFDGPLKKVGSGFVNDRGDKIVTDLILPPSVEEIGYYAFGDAPLKSLRLSESLNTVHLRAFNNCPQLERFYGPHATSDGKGIVIDGQLVAYAGVVDEVIRIPEGVRSIREYVFMNLTDDAFDKVREIVLPEGLVACGYFFYSDSYGHKKYRFDNLEYITIPSTFVNTNANYGSFRGCPNLKKFKGPSSYIWDDGNCLVDDAREFFAYAGYGISDYEIPEGVKTVSAYVFEGKNDLRGLSFPKSTTLNGFAKPVIAGDNFRYFFGPLASEDGHSIVMDGTVIVCVPTVEEYVSPKGATAISNDVFMSSAVKTITLRDCVTSIAADGFAYAGNLETVTFSKNMKSVGTNPFEDSENLKTIYFRSSVPPSCGTSNRTDFPSDFVIYVPKGSLNAYLNSPDWAFLPRNFKEYEPEDTVVPDWYVSKDYSRDGKVEILQRATEGNGIDLVLMGDAFSDRQISQGAYGKVIEKMEDAFFSVEPYKSYRNLFNIYRVDVVSEVEGYAHPGQALGTWFGKGTEVGGLDDTCFSYARRAVGSDRMDNVLVIVAMDTTAYAGTCYMTHSSAYQGDWGEGPSVAYFPLGKTDDILAQLVHHEAGGHGFAKLADEYAYESQGPVTPEKIDETHRLEPYGWWRNIDFTSDPAQVKWSHFLKDERYRNEGLGVYEGGLTFISGVWRPSRSSIMLNNTGGFNAPSREAIWYRLHKLAYGKDWQYHYEDFVSYDAVNRKASVSAPSYSPREMLPPLHPPVVTYMDSKEADKK